MTRVLYFFSDQPAELNCSIHNCFNPTNAINKTGVHTAQYLHISKFVENSEETQKLINESDILILERNIFNNVIVMLAYWKIRGKSIMIIFDDAYQMMHPKNVSYDFWTNGIVGIPDEKGIVQERVVNPKPLEQLKWGLQMSKGLQTVSQALCDDWSFATDTYLIHNHLVWERYQNQKRLFEHKGIWIGWTGSLSHMDSFESSGLLRAFRKVCKKREDIKVLIAGDKRIFDALDMAANKKIFSNFVPSEQYPGLIKSLDIYTIPLSGNYDLRRSAIKPLECMALQVPFLATNFSNYSHLAPYGDFTENGWSNWEEKLDYMIDHIDEYRQKAIDVGYPYAATQNIDLHVQERIDLYQKIIDKPYR